MERIGKKLNLESYKNVKIQVIQPDTQLLGMCISFKGHFSAEIDTQVNKEVNISIYRIKSRIKDKNSRYLDNKCLVILNTPQIIKKSKSNFNLEVFVCLKNLINIKKDVKFRSEVEKLVKEIIDNDLNLEII